MSLTRPSVLLIDDDPAIRAFLTTLLERDGCETDFARDGEEGLRKLRKQRYTTILLDLLMPRVNGFEVLQDIRALQPDILEDIVVLTAASDQTLRHFADEERICKLLRKPLDNAELLQLVNANAVRHGIKRTIRPRLVSGGSRAAAH